MEKRENSKGLFYGVIGVATLLIAIIGATFSWYIVTVGQDGVNENVRFESGTLILEYTDGEIIKPSGGNLKLQPSYEPSANNSNYAYTHRFKISNVGTLDSEASGTMTIVDNTFNNNTLMYKVVRIGENGSETVVQQASYINGTANSSVQLFKNMLIKSGTTGEYKLYVWMPSSAGNVDMNKTFTGVIKITGYQINDNVNK